MGARAPKTVKFFMLKTIYVNKILPNLFNVCTTYDEDSIKEIADEIEVTGFWNGSLRGRMKGDKVELCFGHRRLMALKKLKVPVVQVDIVALNDDEMAIQGLTENLQRRN